MIVVKVILLAVLIGLTMWLTIDTTIWAVKKIKAKKKEKQDSNSQKSE